MFLTFPLFVAFFVGCEDLTFTAEERFVFSDENLKKSAEYFWTCTRNGGMEPCFEDTDAQQRVFGTVSRGE